MLFLGKNNTNEFLRLVNARDIKLYLKSLYNKIKSENIKDEIIIDEFLIEQDKCKDGINFARLSFNFFMGSNQVNITIDYNGKIITFPIMTNSFYSIIISIFPTFFEVNSLSKPEYKEILDFLCLCSDDIIETLNTIIEIEIAKKKEYSKNINEVLKQRNYNKG